MIYCLYTEDEVYSFNFQGFKKRVMAAAHSWTLNLILVWIIADTTGKTPGNIPLLHDLT